MKGTMLRGSDAAAQVASRPKDEKSDEHEEIDGAEKRAVDVKVELAKQLACMQEDVVDLHHLRMSRDAVSHAAPDQQQCEIRQRKLIVQRSTEARDDLRALRGVATNIRMQQTTTWCRCKMP
jgi:hypothetical protein